MSDVALWQRKADRERRARLEAERLLEQKSRELYEANEETRELAERSQAILDLAAEGILVFDRQGQIELFNGAAANVFGCDRDAALGRSVGDYIPELAQHEWNSVKISDDNLKSTGVRENGESFPLEMSLRTLSLRGQLVCTVTFRDMTRRLQIEAQLARSRQLESVGQLAAGVAHEINTPIQYVADNLRFLDDAFRDMRQLVKTAGDHPQDFSKRCEELDIEFLLQESPLALSQSLEGVDRVAKIVSAMREFSHPGAGEMSRVDVNHVLQSAATVCRNEWKYVAELEMLSDTNLPELKCDVGALNQALLNLIVNAAHSVREHLEQEELAGKGSIELRTRNHDGVIEISIKDTGIGIPKELHRKIFAPFFTTKPVGQGTGQGLAIAHSVIVERHRGAICIESEEGEGATFRVYLPADDTVEDLGGGERDVWELLDALKVNI